MAIRNIFVPFDFGNDSELALTAGYDLEGQLGAELHLVHVIDGKCDFTAGRQAAEQLMAVVLPAQELHHRVHQAVLLGGAHGRATLLRSHAGIANPIQFPFPDNGLVFEGAFRQEPRSPVVLVY